MRLTYMPQAKFEIVTTTTGVVSIRNNEVNEIMHNPVGPWKEANALYIEQSNFAERLKMHDELVVFDVGLGAAANALAAIACFDHVRTDCKLRLVSFERDLELLRFALDHASEFEHFRGYESLLEALLEKSHVEQGGLSWSLRKGDFVSVIEKENEKPHLIFFDPYSPKVNTDMWTTSTFKKLRARARSPEEGGTVLYTYSQATRIRVALICVGFFVGYGQATGLKKDTTEAATSPSLLRSPLPPEWHQTYLRSDSRYPFDCFQEEEALIDNLISRYFTTQI